MFERILEQNCQTFDNFNFEFSMSHHNAHYQSYKNAPKVEVLDLSKLLHYTYLSLFAQAEGWPIFLSSLNGLKLKLGLNSMFQIYLAASCFLLLEFCLSHKLFGSLNFLCYLNIWSSQMSLVLLNVFGPPKCLWSSYHGSFGSRFQEPGYLLSLSH